MVPVLAGQSSSHSTWSWSQAGPDGWCGGPVFPHVAGVQQGLKSSGLGRERRVSQQALSWGQAWTGSGDPSGCGSRGMAEGQVFWHGVGLGAGGRSG
jgi:hypothetical protein